MTRGEKFIALIEEYCEYASGRLQTVNIKITLIIHATSLLTCHCYLE